MESTAGQISTTDHNNQGWHPLRAADAGSPANQSIIVGFRSTTFGDVVNVVEKYMVLCTAREAIADG